MHDRAVALIREAALRALGLRPFPVQLMGALAITEMTLALAGIPHHKGGAQAAVDYLIAAHAAPARAAAE